MSIADKLQVIAENEQRVYQAGYEKGLAEGDGSGYDQGYAAGQQAEYDCFWDVYQANIALRGGYAYCFYGQGWNPTTFKPKYDFDCGTNSYAMFSWSDIVDIEKTIDARNCTNFQQAFLRAEKLKTIRLLRVSEKTNLSSAFSYTTSLENITFDGEIGNSIGFINSSKLTDASVQSIIDHLKDMTGETAPKLTFHADVGGRLTQAQKDAISAKNWTLAY